MKIRNYKSSDFEALVGLIEANTPNYFAPNEVDEFKVYLQNDIQEYFVLEVDGKVLGCAGINYYFGKEEGVLAWGMVHPEHHRKHYGEALLLYRLAILKNDDEVKRVTVKTSQHADGFFAKYNFKLLEFKKDHWGPGLDLYSMQWKGK